jgi:hypothetical protein
MQVNAVSTTGMESRERHHAIADSVELFDRHGQGFPRRTKVRVELLREGCG